MSAQPTNPIGVPGFKLAIPLGEEAFIDLPPEPFDELLRPTIQQLTADETSTEIFFTTDQIVLMARFIVAIADAGHTPTSLVPMTLAGAARKD